MVAPLKRAAVVTMDLGTLPDQVTNLQVTVDKALPPLHEQVKDLNQRLNDALDPNKVGVASELSAISRNLDTQFDPHQPHSLAGQVDAVRLRLDKDLDPKGDGLASEVKAVSLKLQTQLDPKQAHSLAAQLSDVSRTLERALDPAKGGVAGQVKALTDKLQAQIDPKKPTSLAARVDAVKLQLDMRHEGSFAHAINKYMAADMSRLEHADVKRIAEFHNLAETEEKRSRLLAELEKSVEGGIAALAKQPPQDIQERLKTACVAVGIDLEPPQVKNFSDFLVDVEFMARPRGSSFFRR